MKKTKTLSNTMYERLFEKLFVVDEEDADDDILIEETIEMLREELMDSEPVCGIENGELHISRLSMINSVIHALLPGYRLVVEVDEDEETIGEVYLAEV